MSATPAPAPAPAPAADGAVAAPVALAANSSLYVGDLDREVTEQQLFEVFSQIGPVGSIRVCRDAVTRRSLGYAYVNYNGALDAQAATRALDALNFTPLNGKPIRIMWSHRDPSYRKNGLGNIFIKNLDKSIDNKSLHDTFSTFGRILSCKVASDSTGASKGYGFVHFETDEAAQLAITKVNGMMIEEKIVYVGPFQPREDRPTAREIFNNVFVKNLPAEDTDDDFVKLVGEFGEVTSAVIMKGDSGSKGFGFVNFKEPDAAAKCVESLQGREYKGKTLYASRAQKKTERQAEQKAKLDEKKQERQAKFAGMNLYVKNLADDVDDEDLRNEFSQFGTITSARVMRDPGEKGKSKGFGFVCFSTTEEATRAVAEMGAKMLKGKPLYVALAQRKETRRAQLEQAAMQRNNMMPRQAGPMGPGMPFGGPMPFMAAGPGGMAQRPGGPGGFFPAPFPGAGPRGMPGPGRGGRGGPGMGYPGGPGGYPGGPYGAPQMMAAPGRGGGRGGPIGSVGVAVRGGAPAPVGFAPAGFQGRGGRGGQMPGRGALVPGRGRGPAGAPPPPPGPPGPVDPSSQPLNAAMLAAAAPEQQKTMIGERLFPLVAKLQPELAGKITGMLLEMDNGELLLLLESNEALTEKVDEAIKVLKEHNAIPAGVNVA